MPSTIRPSRALLTAVAAAAVVAGAGLVSLIATAEFAPDHGVWIAADLVIGLGFVGAGIFAWYRSPGNRIGVLMVATGFAWDIALLARTEPPLLFATGFALENLYVALAVHLLLAYPSGRLETGIDRGLVAFTYFVISEALTNITKYPSASRAWVAVVARDGRLELEVGDDGVGGADARRGTGLSGLADRLDAIDGRLEIESEPGVGTTVRATMPSA